MFSFRVALLPPQFRLNESDNEAIERLILALSPDIPNDLWSIVKYGISSIAFRKDWIKKLEKDICLFQLALFWNEVFDMIKQKVCIELGVDDKDLDLDQTQPQDMNVTGIPNHVVLLTSQRNVNYSRDSWCIVIRKVQS